MHSTLCFHDPLGFGSVDFPVDKRVPHCLISERDQNVSDTYLLEDVMNC
jgi:hypothetical protein